MSYNKFLSLFYDWNERVEEDSNFQNRIRNEIDNNNVYFN